MMMKLLSVLSDLACMRGVTKENRTQIKVCILKSNKNSAQMEKSLKPFLVLTR